MEGAISNYEDAFSNCGGGESSSRTCMAKRYL